MRIQQQNRRKLVIPDKISDGILLGCSIHARIYDAALAGTIKQDISIFLVRVINEGTDFSHVKYQRFRSQPNMSDKILPFSS